MRARHEDGFWGRLLCKTFPRNKPGSILTTESPEKEPVMRMHASFLVAVTMLMGAGVAGAQQAAPAASAPPTGAAAAPPDMSPVANPVSTFVKAGVARYQKNMTAAAEAMPAEKYGFKPSPEMNSYGHLMMHIAQTNNTFCAKISGQAEPDPKDKLVAAIKDSFAFCTTALEKVDDSKLGEQIVVFGNRPMSRGGALVALGGSWTDHYATQAIYLRLNGILPPTAQPEKK